MSAVRSMGLSQEKTYAAKENANRFRYRVNVTLDGMLFEFVKEIAEREGASMATTIRDLVEDGLLFRDNGRPL